MQRVVLLFAAILSVVMASLFGLDWKGPSSPLWNTIRSKKINLGKYVSSDSSTPDLHNLFGDSDYCPAVADDIPRIPDDPCVYVAQNNVRIVQAIAVKNLDSLTFYGLEECSDATYNIYNVANDCFRTNDDHKTVYLISIFNESAVQEINDFAKQFGDLDLCEMPSYEHPGQRCVLIGPGNIHLMNVLTRDNIAEAENKLKHSGFTKCVTDTHSNLVTTEQCYKIGDFFASNNKIQFFNLSAQSSRNRIAKVGFLKRILKL